MERKLEDLISSEKLHAMYQRGKKAAVRELMSHDSPIEAFVETSILLGAQLGLHALFLGSKGDQKAKKDILSDEVLTELTNPVINFTRNLVCEELADVENIKVETREVSNAEDLLSLIKEFEAIYSKMAKDEATEVNDKEH